MKGLAVLCLSVLWLMPTASFAAELPLTPPLLEQIKAEVHDSQARLDKDMTTEELRESLEGRLFGLQVATVASAAIALPPRRLAFLINTLHTIKHTPMTDVEPGTIRHEAIMHTYNLIILGLHHYLEGQVRDSD